MANSAVGEVMKHLEKTNCHVHVPYYNKLEHIFAVDKFLCIVLVCDAHAIASCKNQNFVQQTFMHCCEILSL